MLSSTDEASSITGKAIPLPKSCREPTSVEASPVATPAIASPSCNTIEMVTFRDVTLAMRSPNATPHIVLASFRWVMVGFQWIFGGYSWDDR